MDTEKVIKSNEEQAVGAWVNYLNQVRLDRLVSSLNKQDANLEKATDTLEKAFSVIKEEIVERNRGGDKGMHGFIAEIAECGIGNARKEILGKAANYQWINDNGPVDLLRGTQAIQQKFVQTGGHLSLGAINEHLATYPDYIKNGGVYQIPQDHYEKIQYYLSISPAQANKMPTSTGEFSLSRWKEIHAFFNNGQVAIDDIEPSILSYDEVQKNTIAQTFEQETNSIKEIDKNERKTAYDNSKPTITEGIKVTAASAAIEGCTAFCMAIAQKRKSGKRIRDFEEQDWKDIAGSSGKGLLKGGVRGSSMYLLTNYTATPAAVASAIATASFSIAEQAHLFRTNKINELEFIEHSELLCLEAAVSALSSFAGQYFIPIPILGAVIGNTVGMLMYHVANDCFKNKEQQLIKEYLKSIDELDEQLTEEYRKCIKQLNNAFNDYVSIIEIAFSNDYDAALSGSSQLAIQMGVPTSEVLTNKKDIEAYFMA